MDQHTQERHDTKLNQTGEKLVESLAGIPVIDAHEHLLPEKQRTGMRIDFSILFSQYAKISLASAGMSPEDCDRLFDYGKQGISVREKWKLFREHYPSTKHASLLRPARIWIEEVLGYEGLDDDNFEEISDRLQEANTPGIYNKILRDMCKVETVFACRDRPEEYDEEDRKLINPLLVISSFFPSDTGFIQEYFGEIAGKREPDLDEYLEWIFEEKKEAIAGGVWGVKSRSFPGYDPDRKKAQEIMQALHKGSLKQVNVTNPAAVTAPLTSVIYERGIQFAEKHGLPVAVHSGVWGDFRTLAPGCLIPVAQRHPRIRFDLFHLGMPYVREAIMVATMLPNVSLNLTWAHAISEQTTIRAIDECLDMVPLNKITAFGADYGAQIENVYGCLKMTKENVARALARRIDAGRMDFDEAMRIANMWFYDNPRRTYSRPA